ncbi:hypothetical protein [Criblamydia sequanensis]|uniref:Chaperone protein DnaK n=1 Tax=Candidatus Criblamydia sequanensis CRIB-18 TaxID=1437425 RepID=A0A090D233_9BACT|nr:hypothetical protein [Criblamydia sequanensis]CDR34033.1 Chaperone protein DnaK [Criblamydia sequanensis CRIB-18]
MDPANFSQFSNKSNFDFEIGLIKGMKDINAGNVKNITVLYLDETSGKLDKLKEYFEAGRLVFIDEKNHIKLSEEFYKEFGDRIEKVELISSKGKVKEVIENEGASISSMTGEESEHLSQAVAVLLQAAAENKRVAKEEKGEKSSLNKDEKSHRRQAERSSIRSEFQVKDAASIEKNKEGGRLKELEKQNAKRKEEQELKKAEKFEELHHRIVQESTRNYDRKKQEKKEIDKKEDSGQSI